MNIARAIQHGIASKVVPPLYIAYRYARTDYRPAARAYRTGLRFRQRAAGWDREQKAAWILEQLRSTVRRAYATTPYYRALLDRLGLNPSDDFSFDEFAQIPPLQRSDIHAAGHQLRSRAVEPHLLREDATGGSTGTPTTIWTGPEERGWGESGIEFFMRAIGLRSGSSTGMLWGHHLDPVESDRLSSRIRSYMRNERWYECLRLSPRELRGYHRELERWRPDCILAYASALSALADVVHALGDRPQYPRHCFVTGAEKLQSDQRARIEEVFGRPIHERYGSRDAGLIGFQTGAAEGVYEYEIDWSNILVEPETSDREAAILVTKLHGDGMPMLRYRINDWARFPHGSEPGRPTFTLEEVLGRATERIWLRDGHWVHGNLFPHLLKDYPIREYQVVQNEDYSITLFVVPKPDFTQEHADALVGIVRANAPGLVVHMLRVDHIERTKANKWLPVVTRVRKEPVS